MNKEEIRKNFKNIRKNISDAEVEEKSKLICQNFITNFLEKNIINYRKKVFASYFAINNEADPTLINHYLRTKNIKIIYPKIIKNSLKLDFIFPSENNFVESDHIKKIQQPKNGELINPDIVIVPLLSFDDKLNRIGMGGGFYDTTLQYLSSVNHIITVGLAFDKQRFEGTLPTQKHDQQLDFIITETKIFSAIMNK
jgi:5-formyltetrahydrofolate cyclo-ligase